MREYAFDATGLHELARISFYGKPNSILCDNDRRALIVVDLECFTRGVWICRRAQTSNAKGERVGCSRKGIALPRDHTQFNILCWARVDETHLAIGVSDELLICEFVWVPCSSRVPFIARAGFIPPPPYNWRILFISWVPLLSVHVHSRPLLPSDAARTPLHSAQL